MNAKPSPLYGYRRSIKDSLKPGDILGIHGDIYNLFDASTIKIDLEQIAVGLGRTPRYYGDTGHVIIINADNIFSVGQHIVMAVRAAIVFGNLPLAWEMFVHDMPEHWLSDMKSPIKILLGDKYREVEDAYLKRICEHFKVAFPLSDDHKVLDTNLAEWETTVFMGGNCQIFKDYWSPRKAAEELMNVYEELRALQVLQGMKGLKYAEDYKPTTTERSI